VQQFQQFGRGATRSGAIDQSFAAGRTVRIAAQIERDVAAFESLRPPP
jgi:hypothetical protein